MKRLTALLLSLLLLCALLGGCGKQEAAGEIRVFAAASLTETLTELGTRFEAAHPGVKLIFNFESSGKLMDQILAGADCDLFLSAAPKQMNRLDAARDAADNPEGNDLLLAMGGEGVPVGQYTQKILAYYGLEESALAQAGVLSYGENVKAVATQVAQSLADCGIVYQTDASAAGLTVVDTATEAMCGRVVYPAALLKRAANPRGAADFLAYLRSREAGELFRAVGFTPLAED